MADHHHHHQHDKATTTPISSSTTTTAAAATTTIPMPKPTRDPPPPLTSYKVLSFDVYGTLIEYKSHILAAFTPLLSRLSSSSSPLSPYLDTTPLSAEIPNSATKGQIAFLKLFQQIEDTIKLERPLPRFDAILVEIWWRVARALEVSTTNQEAEAFGSARTIASWPCFEGTVEALNSLARRYRLVALSNIDRFAWDVTTTGTGTGTSDAGASQQQSSIVQRESSLGSVPWWKVFTAEDFEGVSNNADQAKLETLLDFCCSHNHTDTNNHKEGTTTTTANTTVKPEEILHIAQSLGHDHVPAKTLGLSSVFLVGDGSRWGKEVESRMVVEKELVGYAWRCRDLKEFATLVERAFT